MTADDDSPFAAIRARIGFATQIEFARALDVDVSCVNKWEAGTRRPRYREMQRIRRLALRRGIAWRDEWFFAEA